jgi:predicted Ser/Thr protein kinase
MDGISTRFAFKVLSETFNHDTTEVAADPVHLMYVLEQAIRASSFPDETEKRYLEFIKGELAPRYAEFIGNEIQKAYLEATTTTARTCSTATSPMPTPGSRIRTSRIPTPASSWTASCSTRS